MMENLDFSEMVPITRNRLSNSSSHGGKMVEKFVKEKLPEMMIRTWGVEFFFKENSSSNFMYW